jgi:hypothetical protein
MAEAARTDNKDELVSVASIELDSSYNLGHLFRGLASSLLGVSEVELASMRSMPVSAAARMTVAGEAIPTAWYITTLPGASDGMSWALVDPATLLEKNWEFAPYPDVTIRGEWTQVQPLDAPWTWGWRVKATFAMDPDATLLRTIEQHRKVITEMAISGRRSLRFEGVSGVLHMEFLGRYMAPA